MFKLTEKRALLTGATGGLGRCIAKELLTQGATVILSATNQNKLEDLGNELKREIKGNIYILPCNLEVPEEVNNLITASERLADQVDIVINNAGVTSDNLLVRMKDEDFQKVLQVNLEAPFRIIRSAMRGMIKRRWGRIINITSIVGITGNSGQANYAASKAALIGLSKSIAAEVAMRNITVNCIAPGFITSPMTTKLNEEQVQRLISNIPMKSMGEANDIACACIYLASEEARYITGQTLHINGGMIMV